MSYSQWVRLQPAIFVIGGLVVLISIVGAVAWAAGGLPGVFGHPGEQVTREFVHAITAGDSDKARDLICPINGGGLIVVVAVNVRWSRDSYEGTFAEGGESGLVHVRGRVEVNDADFDDFMRNIAGFLEKYGAEYGVALPNAIPSLEVNVSSALDIDFDQFAVRKNNNRWCVEYKSLFNFYDYLIKLAIRTFEVQP